MLQCSLPPKPIYQKHEDSYGTPAIFFPSKRMLLPKHLHCCYQEKQIWSQQTKVGQQPWTWRNRKTEMSHFPSEALMLRVCEIMTLKIKSKVCPNRNPSLFMDSDLIQNRNNPQIERIQSYLMQISHLFGLCKIS